MSQQQNTETTETTTTEPAAAKPKKARAKKATEPKPKKEPKAKSEPITYPFTSKNDIVKQIDSDDSAALAALTTIHNLDAGMCSQKKQIAELAGRVAELGDAASQDSELVALCRSVSRRYGRRLAVDSRAKALAANPDLQKVAKLFSADV